MEYGTKKDKGLVLVVGVLLLINTLGGLLMAVEESGEYRAPGVMCILLAVATAVVMFPPRYALAERELRVRGGPFRWRVAYPDIQGVAPIRSYVPAPAWSLDRLEITHLYRGQRVPLHVAPADRQGFLDALAARCPHLVREDDRLVAVPPPPPPPGAGPRAPPPPPPPPPPPNHPHPGGG
jgi:hypothetical protein